MYFKWNTIFTTFHSWFKRCKLVLRNFQSKGISRRPHYGHLNIRQVISKIMRNCWLVEKYVKEKKVIKLTCLLVCKLRHTMVLIRYANDMINYLVMPLSLLLACCWELKDLLVTNYSTLLLFIMILDEAFRRFSSGKMYFYSHLNTYICRVKWPYFIKGVWRPQVHVYIGNSFTFDCVNGLCTCMYI